MRLLQKSVAKEDPSEATKAISCYGLYLPGLEETWLRFVDGRPVSSITTQFLSLGAPRSSKLLARKSCSSSGTTLAGTSARRSGAGSVSTTAGSKTAGAKTE
jgi:hypothetical protein